MSVDSFGLESPLYAMLDAEWMRSGNRIDLNEPLGDEYTLNFKAQNYRKEPIEMNEIIGSKYIGFSLNVYKDKIEIFRVDNDHGFLHLHLESDNIPFQMQQKLPEEISISGCISSSFELLRNTVKEKYPTTEIIDSEGFVGCK